MIKLCFRLTLVLSFLSLFLVPSHAVPPKDWKFINNKPEKFRPCRPISSAARAKLKAKGAISKEGIRKAVPIPNPKILVIRVKFPEAGSSAFTTSLAAQEALFDQFTEYYLENSYGQLNCSVTLTNEYQLDTIEYYNNEDDDYDLLDLKTAAVDAANGDGVDFTPYDYIMILHAGYGEEETGNPHDIWSLFLDTTFYVDDKEFTGFCIVPECSVDDEGSTLGTICHEFGHQLGLPDLYNTSLGISTCGAWSLMDFPYGFDRKGTNPPHIDPWCKNETGFINAGSRTISGDTFMLMGDIETSGATGYFKIPSEVSADEYFLVEYRDPAKSIYDKSLPGPSFSKGILIWRIDEAQISARMEYNIINNDPSHLAIDLIEADSDPIYTKSAPGNAADAFDDDNLFTTPQSDTIAGLPTGITVADFRCFAGYATANATKLGVTTITDLIKIACYPNPAGKGHPPSMSAAAGTISTIVCRATRPPAELTMHLYTLAGERVLSAAKNDFSLKLEKSGDYLWVYEYDWNGRNESGGNVAPGLYFYMIRADKEVKSGKIAVVR